MPERRGQEGVPAAHLVDASEHARGGNDRDRDPGDRGEPADGGALLRVGRSPNPEQQRREAPYPHPDRAHVRPLDGDVGPPPGTRSGSRVPRQNVRQDGGGRPQAHRGHPAPLEADRWGGRGDSQSRGGKRHGPPQQGAAEGRLQQPADSNAGIGRLRDAQTHHARDGDPPCPPEIAPAPRRGLREREGPHPRGAKEPAQPNVHRPPGGDRRRRWRRRRDLGFLSGRGRDPDAERERPAGHVSVDLGHGPPRHRIRPLRQGADRDREVERVPGHRLRGALIHGAAAAVEHPDDRELRLRLLGEGDRHVLRRPLEDGPGPGLRVAEEGMRARGEGEGHHPEGGQRGGRGPAHVIC